MSYQDLVALRVTLQLALVATILLMAFGTPVAWWLSRTRSRARVIVAAIVTLPLVLPPTVIGFYLLLAMGPDGPIGRVTQSLGLGVLPFTFFGLVISSMLYSMPFVIHPLKNAFESIGTKPMEAAATLRASPLTAFFTVAIPLIRPGLITAFVLGFAHTVGEFGVVLMLGGSIPGRTRVASVQIYDHVEALEYTQAHWLAGILLVFSFAVLLLLYALGYSRRRT